MYKIILLSFAIFACSVSTHAEIRIEKYSSVARDNSGNTAYEEKHEVTFNDRQVQRASTKYLDSKGQVFGEMTSNFTKMITIPDYDFKDLRTGTSHGIKINGEKITLWNKTSDGQLSELDFFKNKFAEDTLIVGCQGLHYYLIDNLERVKEKKKVSIAYFIPGKLDYYKFTLRLDREDDKYIYLKLSIDNFFLKLFTSALDLKYNKSDRRLVQFSGLSNITDDKDELQNVVINYKYN